MKLGTRKLPALLRRAVRQGAAEPVSAAADGAGATPAREPEDDMRPSAEPAERGWRGSSYDLERGLDVVELPTALPAEVLDRLFGAPGK